MPSSRGRIRLTALALPLFALPASGAARTPARAAPPNAAAPARASACDGARDARTDSAIVAAELRWARAAETHDTTTLACILDPRFVDTSWRGALRTRAGVLATRAQAPPGLAQRYAGWSIDRFGDVAVVRGSNTIADGAGHVVVRLRFTDVLRWERGRWVAVAAQETPVREEGR